MSKCKHEEVREEGLLWLNFSLLSNSIECLLKLLFSFDLVTWKSVVSVRRPYLSSGGKEQKESVRREMRENGSNIVRPFAFLFLPSLTSSFSPGESQQLAKERKKPASALSAMCTSLSIRLRD